jgi:hypothetical protein
MATAFDAAPVCGFAPRVAASQSLRGRLRRVVRHRAVTTGGRTLAAALGASDDSLALTPRHPRVTARMFRIIIGMMPDGLGPVIANTYKVSDAAFCRHTGRSGESAQCSRFTAVTSLTN